MPARVESSTAPALLERWRAQAEAVRAGMSAINIVRPLTDKVPLVRATGDVIHAGGRMATADGRLTGVHGKLYAHALTPCFIFDIP